MLNSNLEVLDYQIEYFSRPDAQLAKTENGSCAYLDEATGNKCAIGCLIDDKYYFAFNIADWEGESVNSDLHTALIAAGIISNDVDLYFLERTQLLHDSEAENAEGLVRLLLDMRDNEDY